MRKRTGRPAGTGGNNRERILLAARELFSTAGFRGATLRSIAHQAGVDVALIAHYFGGKDALFIASMQLPDGAIGMLADALSGPPETQGERLVRGYFSLWEDPASGPQILALVRSALSNDAASDQLRAVLTGTIAGLALEGRGAAGRARFTLAMGQLLGIGIARYLVGVPALAELDIEELVRRTAPGIQLQLNPGPD